MNRRPGRPFCLLAAAALAVLSVQGTAARAAPVRVDDACAGASMPINAVIRFYLAIDRRQFAAAYRCFTAAEQARLPYRPFVAGYAQTLASRLVLAESDPEAPPGQHWVSIDLHAVDTAPAGLIASTYLGYWIVSGDNRLDYGHIHKSRYATVSAIPPLNIPDIFAYDRQGVLAHVRADVTGDGKADDIYITSGAGCASCHAQKVWIFSGGRLVFAEEVTNGEIRVARDHAGFELRKRAPDATGPECCGNKRTYEEWTWTPYGFTLRSSREVKIAPITG